ncbi:M10 family metallopeptidase C-terminal domain-containing protein [Neogemmobacter tilapiae]|uniref:Peptidase M10 serralysin C-terminal domain-containing protein n=1 Tax=Neogemmobacter tilapiae TaxID=875041 RepID=A0A918TG67_9RHOB|nr:M10 family metallopeptidase C-terminal domain-containing protein [Gemmobacter tilapiae]GHC43684.1 hypothetical protein GCM10007315_00930 [Gemmobacter tilapiae]
MTTGYGGTIILGPEAGAGFGSRVAAIGDINGDGHQDFAVSVPTASDGYAETPGLLATGQIFVFYGGNGDLARQIDLAFAGGLPPDGQIFTAIQGDIANAGIGGVVAAAGDVDGDGLDDLLIGASDYGGTGATRQGYILYGHSGGWGDVVSAAALQPGQATKLILPEGVGGDFTLAGLGDINGDGYRDILVGDPAGTQVHVLFGDGARHPDSLNLLVSPFSGNDVYQNATGGFAVGDLNKDGLADLGLRTTAGLIVVFGAAAMGGRTKDAQGLPMGAGLGFNVPLAELTRVERLFDINGDGVDDLLIEGREDSLSAQTTSFVLFGRTTGFANSVDLAALDVSQGFRMEGAGVSLAAGGYGDANGDGLRDFLVAGGDRVDLVFGQAQGSAASLNLANLDGNRGYIIEGLVGDQAGGGQLADVNGDGFADLILGLPGREGAAIVYGGPRRMAALDAADGILDGVLHLAQIGSLLTFTEPDPVPVGGGNAGHAAPTALNDTLLGTAGDDLVDLLSGHDSYAGFAGDDTVQGGAGRDSIFGDTGNDSLQGGSDADLLSGSTGDDWLDGGAGNDTLEGGMGDDTFVVDGLGDVLLEIVGGGHDTVISDVDWILDAGFEQLRLVGSIARSAEGNVDDNRLQGNDIGNMLKGFRGRDTLWGNDGADTLVGGGGRDILYGGQDLFADRFVFQTPKDSRASHMRDVVHDFTKLVDEIDLRLIDANIRKDGDQKFVYSGAKPQAFSVWWADVGRDILLLADVNGDKKADLEIRITKMANFANNDLLL